MPQRFGERMLEADRGRVCLDGEEVEVAASVGDSYVAAGESPSAERGAAEAIARTYDAEQRR